MPDFPHALNEWTEEEIEIPTFEPVVNKRGYVTGIKHGKRKALQKVMYTIASDPQKVTCNDLQHDWYIPDKHEHVAHCHNCKKRQLIRAVYEKVSDGKILNRDTGEQIS